MLIASFVAAFVSRVLHMGWILILRQQFSKEKFHYLWGITRNVGRETLHNKNCRSLQTWFFFLSAEQSQ